MNQLIGNKKDPCSQQESDALKIIDTPILSERRVFMQEKFRSLEFAINHMEFLVNLHRRSITKHPEQYSDSFKNGQNLIFRDFFPAIQEVREELKKINEEE
ncbi:hypothetical protein J1P26_21965 [Neobacillus sp. MM2021_6]|uniref:hypothetical protein n=1 Tax=Bacillaceae TaxID=186817 RepID=UPI00140DE08D|nr:MULTISPECIES: hypothetical protein [Bacillaceae]MBO0962374.1 hypothetical protein [Neobacillus sp. MM2021_6]NHC20855.1 hypothetical protein [Bacillus sp. MM2020_4]